MSTAEKLEWWQVTDEEDRVRALLVDYRYQCWIDQGVHVNYWLTEITDLITTRNIRDGKLTESAKRTVMNRVLDDLEQQSNELEMIRNECK